MHECLYVFALQNTGVGVSGLIFYLSGLITVAFTAASLQSVKDTESLLKLYWKRGGRKEPCAQSKTHGNKKAPPAQLSWGLTTVFQSGWGLSFNWIIALILFFFSPSYWRFDDVFLLHRDPVWPEFSAVRQMASLWSTEDSLVDSGTVRCPVSAKQVQIISSPPQYSTAGLICPKNIVPKVFLFSNAP